MSTFETPTDAATFDAAINGGDTVIAKFQTRACVICRRLEPGLKQVIGGLTGTLRVMDVDAEDNPALAERYEIRGVPTLIMFKNGREIARCNGFQSASMLREWVTPHIGD